MDPLSCSVIPSLKSLCQNIIESQKNEQQKEQQNITQLETQLSCLHITDKNIRSVKTIHSQAVHKLIISSKTRWWPFDLSQLDCNNLQELDISVSEKQALSCNISYYSNDMFSQLPKKVRDTIKILKITGQRTLSQIGIFPKLRELHATSTPVSHIENLHDLQLEELHICKLTQQHISSLTTQQRQICTRLSIEKTNEIEDLGEFPNLVELTLIGKKTSKI